MFDRRSTSARPRRSAGHLIQRSTGVELSTRTIVTLDVNILQRYYMSMILSFRCKETEKLAGGRYSRKLPINIQRIAARKLKMLNDAVELNDLRVPPANRLEALKGRRKAQHSIRINDQWRLCFRWHKGNASDVEIVDYH